MYRNKKDKDEIRQIIGYTFKNEKLLLQALTRRSALNEGRQESSIGDFQRLEFIGDRVLDMVISDILFDNHPDWNEGQLTQELSRFTNNSGPLYAVAKHLNLGKFLILGSGEEQINLRNNVKALSDALEALVGAIWIDSDHNYKFMKQFIRKQFRVLNLMDFNQEYKEQTVKIASKQMFFDVMDDIVPEFAEFGFGSRGMSVSELLTYQRMKRKATKPLTGLAAAYEKYLEDPKDSDSSSDKRKEEAFDGKDELFSEYSSDEEKKEESDDKNEILSEFCSVHLSESSSPRFFSSSSSSSAPPAILKTGDGLTLAERKLQNCLTQACSDADVEMVKILVEYEGADPTQPDENGLEPLAAAIWALSFGVIRYLETKLNYTAEEWERIASTLLSRYGRILPFSSPIITYSDLLQHYQAKAPDTLWFYDYHCFTKRIAQYEDFQPHPRCHQTLGYTYDSIEYESKTGSYKIKINNTNYLSFQGEEIKLVKHEYVVDAYTVEGWGGRMNVGNDAPTKVVMILCDAMAKILKERGISLSENYELTNQSSSRLKPR